MKAAQIIMNPDLQNSKPFKSYTIFVIEASFCFTSNPREVWRGKLIGALRLGTGQYL